ncbi:rhodanese-like domain-containing protein [Roseiconus lacunae]|uniref:Rhodanese-like domain-containing protein n=1 Tax=Roseiconus lacunae TaxID=2605694 RepID=A0ABT7PQY0_9BACT|nr:rhodanese-like domain-containing protein [Roseiconus lacunae]MDM4018746.1 rhodanese-like domain-containing protein [Roseiconus lacunae]WRQ48559.1 rhodanese-like domain-containing protein [Stieleria sp. HD01]
MSIKIHQIRFAPIARSSAICVCALSLIVFATAPAQAQLGAVFPSLAPVETIKVDELKTLLDQRKAAEKKAQAEEKTVDSDFVLVDVRSEKEFSVSMIPGAITKAEFEKQKSKFKDKTVIAYCLVGGRSGRYASELRREGYDVKNFKGSILGWCQAELPVVTPDGKPTKRVHIYSDRYSIPDSYEALTE